MENEQIAITISRTAETYKRLYNTGRVNAAGVQRAVARGLVTGEKAAEILKEDEANAPAV